MKNRTVALLAMTTFSVGLIAPVAVAATATSPWDAFYNNTAGNCATGHSVVNNGTNTGGSTVRSRKLDSPVAGCYHNNDEVTLKPGRLEVRAVLVADLGNSARLCGDSNYAYNTTNADVFSVNTPITYNTSTCPLSGTPYNTHGYQGRFNGSTYTRTDNSSPKLNFF